ncbi:hypothetical protein NECAME_15993 [Necator americanus]|uniref:Uncharacterized protein n=1 Tax=Necator americanus TaxID=51031 RepID=W2SF63_NECAM|nr:hypothetical protein NECAME_15993 [Necator americanus]ETN68163.1 hypothetical protein NECAME_15993 [Necator americanus]
MELPLMDWSQAFLKLFFPSELFLDQRSVDSFSSIMDSHGQSPLFPHFIYVS